MPSLSPRHQSVVKVLTTMEHMRSTIPQTKPVPSSNSEDSKLTLETDPDLNRFGEYYRRQRALNEEIRKSKGQQPQASLDRSIESRNSIRLESYQAIQSFAIRLQESIQVMEIAQADDDAVDHGWDSLLQQTRAKMKDTDRLLLDLLASMRDEMKLIERIQNYGQQSRSFILISLR